MKTSLSETYKARRDRLAEWLKTQGISAAIFIDNEDHRSSSVRYLTGHPSDAVLAVNDQGKSILAPWDENMAAKMANVDKIVPYTRYGREQVKAAAGLLKLLKVPASKKIEIPGTTTYPDFLHFVDSLPNYDVICREASADKYIEEMRAVKDEYELECTRKACEITNNMIDKIEAEVKNGNIKTETDVALLIERECRANGCEGTGFDTLAAGPARSFGIHCFPSYTSGEFPAQGLSILDFGLKYQGYTSDVTMTFAKGPLTKAQEDQLDLVQKAYDEAMDLYAPGLPSKSPAQKVDEVFAKSKRTMPHSLGHGIGLQAHEAPGVTLRASSEEIFKPGMIATCEPGLYDPEIGGCRLENDILITEEGHEVLTKSRIVRF